MAKRDEIIEIIDLFLEGKMTSREVIRWAGKELPRTPDCEDPPNALITMICLEDPELEGIRPRKEQLLLDREVLSRGVPCPYKELGKTIEAYWLAYTPWEKIVISQIRKTETGERVVEIIEEDWNGKQIFYHREYVPIKEKAGPLLLGKDIQEKRNVYRNKKIKRKDVIQWILKQLQRKSALYEYQTLLSFYWKLLGPDEYFKPEYLEGTNEAKTPSESLRVISDVFHRKLTDRIKKRLNK